MAVLAPKPLGDRENVKNYSKGSKALTPGQVGILHAPTMA